MTVMLISLGFWSLSLLVLLKLGSIAWQQYRHETSPPRWPLIACGLLLLIALPLLMRPHEDIFGGQDTGAYTNMGARLGRESQLLYTDPLLALVPPDARSDFYYYPKQAMYPTKYGSGAVLDEERAIAGNWFQPAMAIAMSLPAAITGPRAVLFITPLFTLCMALAMATLAALLIPRRGAGVITALCFLACPIVLWHGRCPRPEMTAGFLLFAGAAISLHSLRAQPWKQCPAIALGAICIALAPLFHVIAWGPALIAAIIVGIIIVSGRPDFLIYPIIAAAAFALFILQITTIVDTYGLARFLRIIIDHPVLFTGLFIAGMGALGTWSQLVARGRIPLPHPIPLAWKHWGGPVCTAALLAAVAGVTLYARQHPPSPDASPTHFVHPTDLPTVINMISPAMAVLALIGLVILTLRRPTRNRWEIAALLLFVAPACLGIGYLYDFFMVRYTLIALLPTMAIGLGALITMVPDRGRASNIGISLLAAAVCATGLIHRTHLITSVDYRGFASFIQRSAAPIIDANGILLGEYSRLAAPFDHFCGIPTLGLNNEIHADYTRAEAAWARVMETRTNQPAFFITPFARHPVSKHFYFDYVGSTRYAGRRLIGRRWGLPLETGPWGCELKLYRMQLAPSPAIPPPAETLAFSFDPGNMGLRNFANCRTFNSTITGRALAPHASMTMALPTDVSPRREVWLILHAETDSESRPDTSLAYGALPARAAWQRIAPAWWLARLPPPAESNASPARLALQTGNDPIFLTTVKIVEGLTVNSLNSWTGAAPTDQLAITIDTRWARQGSSFKLPQLTSPASAAQPGAYLCTLMAGPEEVGDKVTLSLGSSPISRSTRQLSTGKWTWEVWPLSTEQPQCLSEVTIETDTPFNPKDPRFPKDLAVLMSVVATVPNGLPATDQLK